jgi:alpha-mannosidase
MLPALEKLCVLACLNTNYEYPYEILGESWRTTLLNQFHDTLPGSCIPETYDDCWDMWKWQAENHDRVMDDAFAALVSRTAAVPESKPGYTVAGSKIKARILHFNPVDHAVKTTVEIPTELVGGATPRQVVFDDGTKHSVSLHPKIECPGEPFYEIPERIAFPMELKPHRVTTIAFIDDPEVDGKQNVRHRVDERVIEMENQSLKVVIDKKTAAITSVKFYDGGVWHESVQQGKKRFGERTPEMEPGIKLHSFFDFPTEFAAWNIAPEFRQHPYDSRVLSARIADAGDNHVTAETVVEYPTKNPEKMGSIDISTVITHYTLHHDDPMLYLTMVVSLNGKRVTMKLDIPTCTLGNDVEAEVAYAVDRRSTVPKTARNVERWENVMHTWVNIQAPGNSWGFAVINNGKYGVEYSGGYLGISIIRGQDYPNAHYEAWVYKERFDNVDEGRGYHPSWTDQGNHVLKLALYPHTGTATEARVLERAHAFNIPLLACKIPSSTSPTSSSDHPGLRLPVADPPVCITVVKPAERDGEMNGIGNIRVHYAKEDTIKQRIIIRAVNTSNAIAGSTIDISGLCVQNVLECDLIERKIDSQCDLLSEDRVITKIKANWKPFEIKTFGLLI